MTIEFRCPTCEKKLKTSDEKAGRSAKCPQCGSSVTVPGSSTVAADEFDRFPTFEEVAVPASRPVAAAQVACPMCGGMNDVAASRCLSCGEDLFPVAGIDSAGTSRRFGDVWKFAWDRWTANLGLNVAAALIAFVILMVGYVGFIVLLMIGGFGFAAAGNQPAISAGFVVGILVGYLVLFVVYCYLLIGFSNYSMRQSRHRLAELGAMFPSIGRLGASMLCTIVTAIGLSVISAPGIGLYVYGISIAENNDLSGLAFILVGYSLMMVGWCLGWTLFWPVQYMVADRPGAWLSPLTDGVRMAMSNFKLSLLLSLTHAALMFVGSMACYIGLLFSVPLSFVLFAVAYDRCLRASRLKPVTDVE